jgi:branched-chain amino acid transport system substrate-binding protein
MPLRRVVWILLCLLLPASAATAQPRVKIGVLTNIGAVFSAYAGQGSVVAARLAIEDAGMEGKAELVFADHQNNPDLGVAIARDWFDKHGVEAIFDVPTSTVALAVNALAGEKRRLVFFSTPITDRLTGEECNGYGIAWTWDVYSVAHSATMAQVRRGMYSWFIIAQDYPGGQAMEAMIRQTVEANGGQVVGVTRHPLGETEYASYLEDAKASNADYIAFTAGGADLSSAVGQSREPDVLETTQRVGMMYTTITEVNNAGLAVLQGLEFATAFYWDRDAASRAFAKRFFALHKAMPTMFQAGVYSSVLNYLRAVHATGSTKAETVRDWLRRRPIEDGFARNGRLLANGRFIHDMLLARIKAPSESHAPWDYYQITGTVPAAEAFRSATESGCKLN